MVVVEGFFAGGKGEQEMHVTYGLGREGAKNEQLEFSQ